MNMKQLAEKALDELKAAVRNRTYHDTNSPWEEQCPEPHGWAFKNKEFPGISVEWIFHGYGRYTFRASFFNEDGESETVSKFVEN